MLKIHVKVWGIMEITKTPHTGKNNKENNNWVAPYYGCSLSPGKAAQMSHALHWDKKVISSNLIYSNLTSQP